MKYDFSTRVPECTRNQLLTGCVRGGGGGRGDEQQGMRKVVFAEESWAVWRYEMLVNIFGNRWEKHYPFIFNALYIFFFKLKQFTLTKASCLN